MPEWFDLTQPLTPSSPRMAFLPAPVFRHVRELDAAGPQVTAVDLCLHVGTHVDAPCHFVAGGASIDQIPPERFVLSAVVWAVVPGTDGQIDLAAVEPAERLLRRGDALVLSSGWGEMWQLPEYGEHPFLEPAVARWCVERGVTLVGVDFLTPDMPSRLRPPGFDYPIHNTLLGNGVLIAENLAGVAGLAGARVDLLLAPIPLVGADASPVRALARVRDD